VILSAVVAGLGLCLGLAACVSDGTTPNYNDRFIPASYNVLPTQHQPVQTYRPAPVYTPPRQVTYPRSGGGSGQCVCGDASGCPPGVVPACR
jgi:hypothetical protein